MNRPLLITDCDEVLLHMVAHFEAWLDEAHGIDFHLESGEFASALTDRKTGEVVPPEQIWPLLDSFFRSEMHRQTLVPGAAEALGRIGEVADIVILTNLGDEAHGWRVEHTANALGIHRATLSRHLRALGIDPRVCRRTARLSAARGSARQGRHDDMRMSHDDANSRATSDHFEQREMR
jgi:hypothetical protein